MSSYKYFALDPAGKKTSGIIDAQSEREARQIVKTMNLTPLKVHLTNNKKSKSANNQKPIAISNLNWNKVEIPNHPGNNWVVVS